MLKLLSRGNRVILLGFLLVLAFALFDISNSSENLTSGGVSLDNFNINSFIAVATQGLEFVVGILHSALFFEIAGFPMLVLWLVIGGLFCTFRFGFVNIFMFKHAIDVVRGKYSSPNDPGEVTHFQALVAAVSATVGLGNIAGVAIAVSLGGPGAVVWMMIAGFFGMSAKFAEVTLGQKYRHIDENGKVSGGAFHYLKEGLSEMNMPRLGKILSIIFAILCIGGSLGAGNMFQSNQAVSMLTNSFEPLNGMNTAFAFIMAVGVGIVLIGGIKRIAVVAEAIVPFMAFIYITASLVVLFVNSDKLSAAVVFMFQDAFTGAAVGGGMLGALINGFRRAAFSNEAGLGSAPIAHSAAKTKEPVREGCVALLEPFIDTMVICFITGLVITVTGVYEGNSTGEASGVLLTSNAFATVISWFPTVLSIAVMLFAFSTMITWSYYGERSWSYLFGSKNVKIFHLIFCSAVFIGGSIANIGLIVDFSDLLVLSMALPNLVGVYLLSGKIKKELKEYKKKLKAGEFAKN